MKSHQPIFSYSFKRRSEQLVRICQMRSAKKETYSGGMPCSGPSNDARSLTSVNSSGTVDGVVVGSFKGRRPKRAKMVPVVSTRFSATEREPRYGVRAMVWRTGL